MKYPQNQFDLLVKGLRVLVKRFGLEKESCLPNQYVILINCLFMNMKRLTVQIFTII